MSKVNRRDFLKKSAMSAVGLALTPMGKNIFVPPIENHDAQVVQYREAPELAAKVAKGLLPSVAQRLPVNPLVLTPINKIGTYGGRIRSISGWLGGHWEESQYGHSPLRWIDDGLGIAPGMCDTWETNANNTIWTFHIREGLKWSDGKPVTADDIMYWWNDLVINPDHPDVPPDFGSAGGQLATFTKVNDYTLRITYAVPAPLTARRLAMWVNGNIGPRWIAPKHYLKNFHPSYNSAIKDFQEHDQKILFRQNPDCPSLDSWICVKFVPSESITWDRNPYYYAVDPEGNQLPYINGVDELAVTDRNIRLQMIMQGAVDYLHFSDLTLGDVATLKDNEAKGHFQTRLLDSGSGTGMMYFWNYDFPEAQKRALYRNPKFKQAMSFAMDRPLIHKIIYFNTGTLTTGTLSPKAVEFNFNDEAKTRYIQYRDAYVTYDTVKARALLDEINVKDFNGDGWREYPDGNPLEIRIDIPADAGKECIDVLQIVTQNWKDVGLNITINQLPPPEFGPLWGAGKGEIHTNWEVGDGPDHLLYPSWIVPNEPDRWAPLCGRYYQLKGTSFDGSESGMSPWDRNPPRFSVNDPQYAGSVVQQIHQLYDQAALETDELKRHQKVWQILDLHKENLFFMGTVGNYPRITIVGNIMENVPTREQLKTGGFVNPWTVPFPAIMNPETFSMNLQRTFLPVLSKQ